MSNEIKYITRFAFIPVKLDGQWTWWKKYTIAYEKREYAGYDEWMGGAYPVEYWHRLGEVI